MHLRLTSLAVAGYEKLKPFGFYVHAGIDGGSNFVVYSTVALDKSGTTLLKQFDAATEQFGFPLRLRSDMAFEAGFVGQRMWEHRGPGSYIAGPSTANQASHICALHCFLTFNMSYCCSKLFCCSVLRTSGNGFGGLGLHTSSGCSRRWSVTGSWTGVLHA